MNKPLFFNWTFWNVRFIVFLILFIIYSYFRVSVISHFWILGFILTLFTLIIGYTIASGIVYYVKYSVDTSKA